jgi:hypothetical protein
LQQDRTARGYTDIARSLADVLKKRSHANRQRRGAGSLDRFTELS